MCVRADHSFSVNAFNSKNINTISCFWTLSVTVRIHLSANCAHSSSGQMRKFHHSPRSWVPQFYSMFFLWSRSLAASSSTASVWPSRAPFQDLFTYVPRRARFLQPPQWVVSLRMRTRTFGISNSFPPLRRSPMYTRLRAAVHAHSSSGNGNGSCAASSRIPRTEMPKKASYLVGHVHHLRWRRFYGEAA